MRELLFGQNLKSECGNTFHWSFHFFINRRFPPNVNLFFMRMCMILSSSAISVYLVFPHIGVKKELLYYLGSQSPQGGFSFGVFFFIGWVLFGGRSCYMVYWLLRGLLNIPLPMAKMAKIVFLLVPSNICTWMKPAAYLLPRRSLPQRTTIGELLPPPPRGKGERVQPTQQLPAGLRTPTIKVH